MSHWDFGRSAAGRHDEPYPPDTGDEAGDAWDQGGSWDQADELGRYPVSYERDPWDQVRDRDAQGPGSAAAPFAAAEPATTDPAADSSAEGGAGGWPEWDGGWDVPRLNGFRWRRWLLLAGVAVAAAAVAAGTVLLAGGPGRGASPSGGVPGAPLTRAQAAAVLAAYAAGRNAASERRSDTGLAAIETGSSYAIDAARYRAQEAQNAAPYRPSQPRHATYYIPRDEPASGPRWFVVLVSSAVTSSPMTVSSQEYLLFTQAVRGGPWRNAVEPYLLPRAAAPDLAVGPDGLANVVSPGSTADAVAPGQLPAQTAASLDVASAVATGSATARPVGSVPAGVSTTGLSGLADQADLREWHREVAGGTVTDVHSAAPGTAGPEFALRTADGGALVFYTDAASLTVTLRYAPGQPVTRAGISYLEQFAAYDPPAGGGPPRVVADYSAVTGSG
jgi:hypothetical protein